MAVPIAPHGSEPAARRLWGHRDFMALWIGQSVSEIGANVSQLALPLIAVLVLQADTLQVGLLTTATYACFAILALPAGALVDRLPKRRLMIVCDVARLLLIASVPVASVFGWLTLVQLYVVALSAGACTVFFDVAYQSYLPSLLSRAELDDGNSKLGSTQALASAAGPALGGALVGLIGAAWTMSVDAFSYLVSVTSLAMIRSRADESRPEAGIVRGGSFLPRLLADIGEGLRFVRGQRVLRWFVVSAGLMNFWAASMSAVTAVFLVRVLHLSPTLIGLLYASGALGGLLGAPFARRLTGSMGLVKAACLASVMLVLFSALRPLAEPGWRIALVGLGNVGTTLSIVVFGVAQLSYRQAVAPPSLLGRTNGAVRWVTWGALPLGAAVGSALGAGIGIRPTLWISVVGSAMALLVLLPVRSAPAPPAR